jgi:3-dehydroquinate synthetase
VIPAGEEHKKQSTVDDIILKLIQSKADRKSVLVGVGGGVITDLTGYVAFGVHERHPLWICTYYGTGAGGCIHRRKERY